MSDFTPPNVPGALPGDRCENSECLVLLPPTIVHGKPMPCVCCGWMNGAES